jgi:phospholipid/cholesterol/gamma-HCH transport system permease protein
MPTAKEPTLTLNPAAAKGPSVAAGGTWQVHALAQGKAMATITALLKTIKADNVKWDLSAVDSMDHIGAQLFWNAWGKARPADLQLAPGLEEFFNRLETTGKLELPRSRGQRLTWVMKLGFAMLLFFEHMAGLIRLIGQVTLDMGRFIRAPQRGPWREISANIYHAGFQALGITALVGFLIGVVLSYLSAQQLRMFGGDIYLVNILGMSIIRELGPLLAAILVAGRSGSSITAQLGVMRVTEELDAMLVMGISHGFRLIMPKVLALAIAMPLLVVWTDAMALLGGMLRPRSN